MLLHLPRMDGYGTELRVKNGPALAGHGAEAVRDAIATTITTLPGQYLEIFHSCRWRHSPLGMPTPIEYGLPATTAGPIA
jgi:hypothetical protein